MLLLLVARKICPSSVLLVDNLQKQAKGLTLKECEHDVSAVVNRFKKFLHRIKAQGKEWDSALKALFKVLLTMIDENFRSAILSKQNKYLDGSLTEVSELSKYRVTIYTNLTSLEQWMVPDKKTAQIAALTTQIKDLNQKLASSGTALTTDTVSSEKKNDPKDSSKDAWKFKFLGTKPLGMVKISIGATMQRILPCKVGRMGFKDSHMESVTQGSPLVQFGRNIKLQIPTGSPRSTRKLISLQVISHLVRCPSPLQMIQVQSHLAIS